jgi:hypothetical protein
VHGGVDLALVAVFVPVLHGGQAATGLLAQRSPSLPLLFLVPVLFALTIGGWWPGLLVAGVALYIAGMVPDPLNLKIYSLTYVPAHHLTASYWE